MTNKTTITPKNLYKLLKKGQALLIDVREPDEFSSEHINFAISVPLSKLDSALPDLSADKRTIVFQCQRGTRGEYACASVRSKTLKNHEILNLEGGIIEWKNAGLPVVSKSGKTSFSIMRQVQMIVGFLVFFSVFLAFTGVTLGLFVAGFIGAGLFFAGLTGICTLAKILGHMPWNK